jgi:hypothetical protein
LASKVAKILAGTLRFGLGMTGFGGAWVAPVVVGTLSCALICTLPSRALGAGFGTGTVCEKAGAATAVAISSASPQHSPRWVDCWVIRYFKSLFNAVRFKGLAAIGHFIALSTKGDIVFP